MMDNYCISKIKYLFCASFWLFMAFFPVSAQQKPTFQEKELVEYVIKFLSAKNNQDVNTLQELIHPKIGYYWISAADGITIEHRGTIDFEKSPFTELREVQSPASMAEMNEYGIIYGLNPIFDCQEGLLFRNMRDFCSRKNSIDANPLIIGRVGAEKLLTRYIEAYGLNHIRGKNGQVIHFSRQQINQKISNNNPDYYYYQEGLAYQIDRTIVQKLDLLRTLERNSVRTQFARFNAEWIKVDGKWYILAIDQFCYYCGWEKLLGTFNDYKCSSIK